MMVHIKLLQLCFSSSLINHNYKLVNFTILIKLIKAHANNLLVIASSATPKNWKPENTAGIYLDFINFVEKF